MSWIYESLQNIAEPLRDFLFVPDPNLTEDTLPSLKGKVYLVTGASSGIGFQTARLLVKAGAQVWLFGRTPERLAVALTELREEFPDSNPQGILAKNEDLSTIKPAVDKFLATATRLDGIIHNAGKNWNGDDIVKDVGYQDIIVVNVFAAHLVQKLLDPILIKTAKQSPPNSVRILWITSSSHYLSPPYGGIKWEDLNNVENGYLGFGIYGQTKSMNIYQSILWSKKHENSGVVSISVHPGIISSSIRRNNPVRNGRMERLARPTSYGALAELEPLFNQDITTEDNGKYYIPYNTEARIRPDVLEGAHSPRGEKLWQLLETSVKPYV